MTAVDTAELGGFGELLRSLARFSWFIAGGAVLGVVAATVFVADVQNASATARIGLTDEVGWPSFNATRQRVAGLADGLDPADVIDDDDVLSALVDVEVTLPIDEAFLNVTAVAGDVESAELAANQFAEALVEFDADESLSPTEASLEAINTEIAALEEELTAAEQAFAARIRDQATAETEQEVREADAAAEAANEERDLLVRRIDNLVVERDRLTIVAAPRQPDVEMIRAAVTDELPGSPLRTRQLLGGLTGAVVVGLLAWVLDRSLGIIRTPAALRSATELPVIDARTERGAGRLAIWSDRYSASETIGFIGNTQWLESFLEELRPLLAETATIASPAHAARLLGGRRRAQRLLVALGEPNNGYWFDRGVGLCDETVLLVPAGRMRPTAVRSLIADVAALGGEVSVAVLLEVPDSADLQTPRTGASVQAA